MTKEEKELVLIDLCARLPYGVHVGISWEYSKTDVYTSLEYYEFPNIDSLLNIFWDEKCISIKPYLRPMYSMTEEEIKEFRAFHCVDGWHPEFYQAMCNLPNINNMIYWLDRKMFDHRGLIPMGLALEAHEDMYKLK